MKTLKLVIAVLLMNWIKASIFDFFKGNDFEMEKGKHDELFSHDKSVDIYNQTSIDEYEEIDDIDQLRQ